MRKALVVGINHYESIAPLRGCVNDAVAVNSRLERHANGDLNFGTKLVIGSGAGDLVTGDFLRASIRELFSSDVEVALLYFAGHGHIETTGGYLCAGDCKTGHDGVPLADIMSFANDSRARNRVIILDSCHGGIAGDRPLIQNVAELKEGVTILTASTAEQYATEENGSGSFTTLLVDALDGAASNLVGEITPGSIYAHIDQSLGSWSQRPVFKTNVKQFVSLRNVAPPISLADLRRIAELFPTPGHRFQLDPSFEPERPTPPDENVPPPDPDRTAIFAILQKYNRLNLLVPEGAPHMWHAAMGSKPVHLTALGEHYRRLVKDGLI